MRGSKITSGSSAVDSILRHRRMVVAIVLCFTILGTTLAFLLKPKYKAMGTISISPQYFLSPIAKDFMPEITDPDERKEERATLITRALDLPFLDSVLKASAPPNETPLEFAQRRALLKKNVEVLPAEGSSFQISVVRGSADEAFDVVNRALGSIKSMLLEERRAEFVRLRDVMSAQIRAIVLSSARGSSLTTMASASSSELVREADELEHQIQSQLRIFAPGHPVIRSMKTRLGVLRDRIADQQAEQRAQRSGRNSKKAPDRVHLDAGAKFQDEDQQTIYEDLVQKYEYVNIVLALESSTDNPYVTVIRTPEVPLSPLSPNRPLMILWSLLAGFIFALLAVAVRDWMGVGAPHLAMVGEGSNGSLNDGKRKKIERTVGERENGRDENGTPGPAH